MGKHVLASLKLASLVFRLPQPCAAQLYHHPAPTKKPLALPASGFINFNQRLLLAVPKNFSAVAFGCGLSLWKWFQILPAILFGGRSS